MALHGDNESSGEADRCEDVNPVLRMTEDLSKAYSKAGEEMGKQMAASIVAIVTSLTSGQGQPGIVGWPQENLPGSLKEIIPAQKLEQGSWILIIAPDVSVVPLFQGEPIWRAELMSGHSLLVL